MIQQLFLSLISGLSILLGLEPHSIFFFFEKMGDRFDAGLKVACWGGLVNGAVLLFLKHRVAVKDKKLLVCLILPSLFYQLFCAPYFNVWIEDLRAFSWIFIGSVGIGYFLLNLKGNSGKLFYPLAALLAYVAQVPGSIGLLILILFLTANKIPAKTSILVVLLSLIPGFIVSFVGDASEFISNSSGIGWRFVSISYLISCGVFFFSAELLFLLFKKQKEKALLNFVLGLGIALLFFTSRLGGTLSGEKVYHQSFGSMGTTCELTVWTDKAENLKLAVQEVKILVDSIEEALSTYKPDSEINEMNKTAFKKPFKCSEVLWENLLLAEYAYKISNGGFDVTVGPLVQLWAVKKKRAELPSKVEIDHALKIVGFDKLVLNKTEKAVFFKEKGLRVDFGGLTKGWAVDKASELLQSKGFSKFIVNLGGNLYCSAEPPEGKASFKIGIKDPRYPMKLCTKVEVLGKAVSTSGNYEQFIIIDGKKYTHIIDPRTGYPVGNVDSVTVISPSATLCDILSTAIFVEGRESIADINEKVEDLSILFIDVKEDGKDQILQNGLFEKIDVKLQSSQ